MDTLHSVIKVIEWGSPDALTGKYCGGDQLFFTHISCKLPIGLGCGLTVAAGLGCWEGRVGVTCYRGSKLVVVSFITVHNRTIQCRDKHPTHMYTECTFFAYMQLEMCVNTSLDFQNTFNRITARMYMIIMRYSV